MRDRKARRTQQNKMKTGFLLIFSLLYAVPALNVITAPTELAKVRDALQKAGFKPEVADVTMKPSTENTLTGDDAARMQKLLDALESLDDVQDVYTTAALA